MFSATQNKDKVVHMVRNIEVKDLINADSLRQLLQDMKESEDQYILKDKGQPQAALLSLDDLELLQKARLLKERTWENLFENLERVHARNMNFSAEEVEADVDAAIKEVRRAH
jgi:PHD/YefM family antitoxin component YafN of YafNO toxin-antitoxin module